jgi:hypothetical protein
MAQPQPSPRPSPQATPLFKGLTTLKNEIDKILQKMKRDASYQPERAELDQFSSRAVELIQQYHPKIAKDHKNLLMAVIDLTEIPVMHPKMQKVAFQTALQDASENLEEYLSSAF